MIFHVVIDWQDLVVGEELYPEVFYDLSHDLWQKNLMTCVRIQLAYNKSCKCLS